MGHDNIPFTNYDFVNRQICHTIWITVSMGREKKIDQVLDSIEKLLWKDLKKGCLASLGSLYDLYVDKLFAYGYKISGDRAKVQDEIHNLFLDLYRYHKKLSDVKNIEAYLIMSLKRKLIKQSDHKIKSLESELETFNNSYSTAGLTVISHEEEMIEDEKENELSKRLKKIMVNLTDHQRKILRLRFAQEKTYQQIAGDLGLSVASARTLVYRTLKTIRDTALTLFF
ncbi:sigma-70 family RNA polymerase sigma factor [Flagellimonas pelagia]|jgi:RNA polymerase sigma-70 factor (ECF subfamily)|nr:sigma-70 family RNA polymerase sigma factor [Muricauda sp. D6]MAO15635.1 sigma-70 family RNA polymerase sigma factor [Allomuricauda sp.]RIV45456.1 sigma-70 family RNA polymerase sigma factor [Allomuricauda maritima]TXJ96934.1 sigma-70 family RNA polymerase sigma factor [Allomuricauda maritima]|tara:strand:- start:150 stop:830 length:681 start_codon:yes stop_codon:yes gene_type:complete